MTRHRRTIWIVAASLAIVIATLGIAAESYRRHVMRRFYAFAIYANAYEHCCFFQGMKTPSLEVIESTYNAYDRKRGDIPAPSEYHRPEYRPVATDSDEVFLIFVENPPADAWFDSRYVILSTPDGKIDRVEWLSADEVEKLRDNDDELRKRIRRPS